MLGELRKSDDGELQNNGVLTLNDFADSISTMQGNSKSLLDTVKVHGGV